jgi:ADP-heptose:LPS heptosyltransferase
MSGVVGRFLTGSEESSFSIPGTLGDETQILAIDTGDLSDLLFHVPLLQAVRARFPKARIDILTPEEHVSLIQPSGLVRDCLVYNDKQLRTWSPGYISLARSVRKVDYDLSIVMSFDPHAALEGVGLASGAGLRLGPSHDQAFPAVNFELRTGDAEHCYRGGRMSGAAPFLGLPDFEDLRGWPLPAEKLRRTQQLVHFNKPRQEDLLIGVDPSLGKSGSGLSLQNLHFLLKQLGSQLPCRALPLTVSQDTDRLHQFEAGLDHKPLDLSRDSMFDTILLMAQCDIFIAGNTDLFHYAAAQGVPTLGFFVEADAASWEPVSYDNVRILRIAEGKRVDVDVLMAAVKDIRGSR